MKTILAILLRFAYPIYWFYAYFHDANRSFLSDSQKYHWKTEEAYLPKLDPYLIANLFLLFLPIALLPLYRVLNPRYEGGVLVGIFNFSLLLCCYYPLLLLALPLLRKRFSTETCTALWSLPLLLSIMVVFGDGGLPDHPWFAIRISRQLPGFLAIVWAAGFLGIMSWRLLSHFLYRNRLLAPAEEAPTWMQKLQYETACEMGVDRSVPLLISPLAEGPLSIGVLPGKVRIVFPPRDYTEASLRLILRHEMVHLIHKDNQTKLFMTVLRALFWFLPPVWLGLRQAAEDVELNCDELSTAPLSVAERQQYAGLLLEKAPPATGFTTCLSASARGLRYRMSRILHPKKRHKGYLLGIALVVLILVFYGRVCLAYQMGTLRDAVFQGEEYIVKYGSFAEDLALSDDYQVLPKRDCLDQNALIAYLDSLTLYAPSGAYEYKDSVPTTELCLELHTESSYRLLCFRGDCLYVGFERYFFGGQFRFSSMYYLSETPDYTYLRSLRGEPKELGAAVFLPAPSSELLNAAAHGLE